MPFDLGRPFGAPDEPAFQTKVLKAALALLERGDGPVILDDFPEDAPGQGAAENMEGLVCPLPLKRSPAASGAGTSDDVLVADVLSEVEQLAPWQALFKSRNGRSTVGVSQLTVAQGVRLIGKLLATGECDDVPAQDLGRTLRFVCEDLRNFYLEAAAMRPGGGAPSKQRIEWFWAETRAGELLLALHPVGMASGNKQFRTVAEQFLLPRAQKHRLAKR